MTQPNDLPPLPEPMRKSGQQISYDGADKAFCDMFSIEQMTAYGHQCAEAAVERERARCKDEVWKAVQHIMDIEKSARDTHGEATSAERHRYAVLVLMDVREALLQIK